MKHFQLIGVALAALIATTAGAQTGERSRAEVVAELHAARAAGLLGVMDGEDSGSFHLSRHPVASTLTRAEVRAAMLTARHSGETAALTGELAGRHITEPAWAGTRTRAEVRAEMLLARASGEMQALSGEDSGSVHLARLWSRERATHYAAR
jgi:hypothetical protein